MTVSKVSTDDVLARIRTLLGGRFGPEFDAVADDAVLSDALGDRYDSLGALECITAVEQEFGIEIDFVAHDVRHAFSRVDNMAGFVRDRLEDLEVFGTAR
ncbi:hypothetical protein GCM10022243_43040 [Saccharothrix violaceirubra]|uniref:Acyl carrier protein n=1 Tax=Saccharothrix violaceirubra TaxID=413306 RepID=A0A7W7T3W7_9PSEU|nr:acyl carrier protein [Saccharothrix violaceirubra]MBB4965592.1 acyl carrier protein [Saccharothrix violaceirubra]